MASTNKTSHYELSQFLSSDIPAWLVDYNGDMSKIDTGINTAKTTADNAGTAASNAQSAADGAQNTANTAVTNAATAQSTADGANTKIGTLANLDTSVKTDLVSAINEVKGDFDTLSTYSTVEKIVGTWIDGSPIYRKVLDIGTLPNNDVKLVAHDISNLKHFLKLEGIAWVEDNTLNTLPIPATATDNLMYQVFLSADHTDIHVKTGSNRTGFTKCYVVMEYVKTA